MWAVTMTEYAGDGISIFIQVSVGPMSAISRPGVLNFPPLIK